MGYGDRIESAIEALLVDGLAQQLSRRTAQRVLADVRKRRCAAALPTDPEALLAFVRNELRQATVLRVGARGDAAITDVEERVLAISTLPTDSWEGPRIRLVYVGRSDTVAGYLAAVVHATEAHRVDELFELLMALDSSEKTLVVIDTMDTKLEPAVLARFVPDFAASVTTLVTGACPEVREAFLRTGAAFRALLRSEPLDHPDMTKVMRELITGIPVASGRRKRGGPSTTTEPAHAAQSAPSRHRSRHRHARWRVDNARWSTDLADSSSCIAMDPVERRWLPSHADGLHHQPIDRDTCR